MPFLKRISLSVLAVAAIGFTPPAIAHQATRPVELSHKIDTGQISTRDGIGFDLVLDTSAEYETAIMRITVENLGDNVFAHKTVDETRAEVEKGRESFSYKMKPQGPGRYRVTFLLEGLTDGEHGFSSKLVRYVDIDKDGRALIRDRAMLRHDEQGAREKLFQEQLRNTPDDPDLRLLAGDAIRIPDILVDKVEPGNREGLAVRPAPLDEFSKRYLQQNEDKSWSPEDPITVRGRLTFVDFDGAVRPLVNATVRVYDDDTFGDETLASLVTDWNGNWSVTVNNDDGWLQDGRDIYYKFETTNSRFRVQDCAGIDSTYKWKSATHDNLSEGTNLNFGTETAGSDEDTLIVFNMLNTAWNHATTVGARDPGFVDSCYPETGGTHWDRFWEEIDFEEQFIDGPNVLHHEYAHAIMWFGYGDDNPSPGGSHSFDDMNQDPGLSWSEGWANTFQHSIRPDGVFNWNEGSPGRSLENFSAANRNGNRNEGRVAAALIDMLDAANDTNGGVQNRGRDDYGDDNTPNRVSLATMLNGTLWGSYHDDFEDYWAALSGNLTAAQRGDAQEIMYYNWQNVPEPVSCVASKVAAAAAERPEELLTGLRQFRELGLAEFSGGRQMIQAYYSNSPEMALIILRQPVLQREALDIAQHFSDFGYALGSNERLAKLARSDGPVIDAKMAERIKAFLAQLGKDASPELRAELTRVDVAMGQIAGLSYHALQSKIAENATKRTKLPQRQLRQMRLNPVSEKAAREPALRELLKPVKPPRDLQ
jgi:hypothetical protein